MPCQAHSAPTDPPQCMAGPVSLDRAASMKIHLRVEKAAGKKEKRTKEVRYCTGNTKAREEEEMQEEKEKVLHGGAVIHSAAHGAGRFS